MLTTNVSEYLYSILFVVKSIPLLETSTLTTLPGESEGLAQRIAIDEIQSATIGVLAPNLHINVSEDKKLEPKITTGVFPFSDPLIGLRPCTSTFS